MTALPETARERLRRHLLSLYEDAAADVLARLSDRLQGFLAQRAHVAPRREPLSECTVVVIAYGDHVHEPGAPPLRTLGDVLHRTADGLISDVHVLPFFPYSSDDGFSVVDYERVDPALGDWQDVRHLADRFGLMVDLVINHVSAESRWFQGFLEADPTYADFFIVVGADADLSEVVRPRALPLLTPFETADGVKHVWTTFSADQIDLNYANPEVLLRMLDVLLLYVSEGATLIRLDAVAFLWKEIGGPCIHCEETHRIIKLMRAVLDIVAPEVLLVTETNVPHEENIAYFGDGSDEAQLVYQFPLPPLVVDALHHGDARALTAWGRDLQPPSGQATFFNFLASHDGIGLRPLEGLLDPERVDRIVERTLAHGGRVSYKHDLDGRESAYELNISFFDALSNPFGDESLDIQVRKFITAHAIMLSLAGVPGIYFHSLFGSRSWRDGVELRGTNRAINRERLTQASLLADLQNPASVRSRVFDGFQALLRARGSSASFHPHALQRVVDLDPRLFTVLRGDAPGARVLCLHNVSAEPVAVSPDAVRRAVDIASPLADLLASEHPSGRAPASNGLTLRPYDTAWLTEASG